jgi:hypothetical protein
VRRYELASRTKISSVDTLVAAATSLLLFVVFTVL